MKAYYVYILECSDGSLYTGITTNLERRFLEHAGSGRGAKYTSAHKPLKFIYSKKFFGRSKASIEESRIKKLTRIQKQNLVINLSMEKIIKQLEKEVKGLFLNDSSGHDFYHLKRVLNIAKSLQQKEGGDRIVIAVSAFLHDLHRLIQNETGRFCSPKDSLPKVKLILDKIQLSFEQKNQILHCIEYHEEYGFSKKGKTVSDIETLIVQDADNLDAIGAIGIARTFSYGGAHGVNMWNPEKSFRRKYYDENKKDVSVIHHFYSKLLKLKGNMNTKTAKKMAGARQRYMETFLAEFFDEWNGLK